MRTAISRGQLATPLPLEPERGKLASQKPLTAEVSANPRPGHHLTHVPDHITRAVEAMDSCFALTWAHQHGRAVSQCPGKTRVCFFSYFGGPRGAV